MLPKTLKYGSKVESAAAKSTRISIAPQNGTSGYGLNDTIIINIPTRNNLVLAATESYLKFTCTFTSTAADNAYRFDSCGAHGLISRIRVFSGSNLLQDISEYGMLAKILFDLQQPTDATFGKQSLLAGTRTDTVSQLQMIATAPADVAALKAQVLASISPSYQVNSGERIGGDRQALTANGGTVSDTYCLNLLSLVGSLSSSNYVPLFAMSSAPLRVEIQLVSSLIQGCCELVGASTIALSNVEYIANFIELGDAAMSVIYNSLEGQPIQYVYPDFRNYQFSASIPNNTQTQISMPIPAKFSSLKSIIVSLRDKGTGALTFFPFSSTTLGTGSTATTCGLLDYQFRIGSTIAPPKPCTTIAEFFAEITKAYGSIADIMYTPSIDKNSYSMGLSVASNDSATNVSSSSSGSFYIGIDLESYVATDKSSIWAGVNTNTDDIYLTMNFRSLNRGGAITPRFDAFANFDCVLVCENNTAYVKF